MFQDKINISIVIPGKNEETNISRAINSVIANTRFFKNVEIIFVDSQSTDKTIDLAGKYPIKILQLKYSWTHTPSAGRYIGTLFASSEFIFFMDSDMAIEPDFLEKALFVLCQDKNIAAIGGIGREIYLKSGKESGNKPNLYNTSGTKQKVSFLGGAGLYRKEALIKAGGFNPYLYAGEENELAQRLKKNNHELISLPIPMITHYTDDINEWNEFLRKKNSRLFFGIGQAIRLSHSLKFLYETLSYYKEFSWFLLYLLSLLTICIYALLKNPVYTLIIPLVILSLFFSLVFKKKSFQTALLSLIKWHILSLKIISGIVARPKDGCTYPTNPIIIKGNFDVKK